MRALVAIVDDDPVLTAVLEDLLADEGYRPLVWRQPEPIVEMLRRERPASVILDIRLAGVPSGWEVIEQVRADPELADLRVLVCTADASFLATHAAHLAARGCHVLVKPFDLDDLLRSLARAASVPMPADD